MQKYRFLEHTADERFEAFGKDLSELFENAGMALQEIQVDPKTVDAKVTSKFTVSAENVEMLLFDFLQELIFLKDAEELVFSTINVEVTEGEKLTATATCQGEKIDYKKHSLNVDAKAVTMHQYEVKKEEDYWKAHVIVDI